MRKLAILIGLLAFSPLFAKASLMGFGDGAGLYDETGKQLYTCFPDQSCVGLDNVIYTRTELGVGPAILPASVSSLPQSTPQIVYVPVYLPSNQGSGALPSSPIVSGASFIPATPTIPTITFLQDPNETNDIINLSFKSSSPVILKSVNYHLKNFASFVSREDVRLGSNDWSGTEWLYNDSAPVGFDSDMQYMVANQNPVTNWHFIAEDTQIASSGKKWFTFTSFTYQVPGEGIDRTFNF